MNVKKLLTNTLLVATLLIGGGNFAWAETIGNTTDGYLAAKSTSITLTDGGSVRYVFSQTTANSAVYQGFILAVDKTDDTQLIRLRQDLWENIAAANTGCTANYPEGWVTNYSFFNGATVDMTVTYNSGTFTMSSTIYGSDNGEYTYGYTKTIDGAPSSIVVYLSNDHAKLLIGKTVVTKGTITTTTYDFTSWVTADTQVTLSSTSAGSAYRQAMYIPNVYNDNYFSSNFGFRHDTGYLKTTGLVLPKDNFMDVLNLTAGDKLQFNFSGTVNIIHNQSGNYNNSSSLTLDGTELSGASSVALVSGQTYYDFRDARVAVRPTEETTFTSVVVKHNTSTNYATLFALWKTAVADYNNESYTEGKSTFATAISAAKAVLDADEAPVDNYAAAITVLREADEYFTAINTLNTSYRVASTSVISDGTNVKSVYGITMTYVGTWTFETKNDRLGAQVSGSAIPSSLTNNIPQDNAYITFTPSVSGDLTIKACFYSGTQFYLVDGSNGHIHAGLKRSSGTGGNLYGDYNFGNVEAGHTYYFYATSNNNGYQFGGFTFTPGENTRTSYYVSSNEIINVGSTITSVAGVTMTYGGAAETTWSTSSPYSSTPVATNSGGNATYSGNAAPTAGTFVSFLPTSNGKMSIRWVAYANNRTANAHLTDGSQKEYVQQVNTGNGVKNDVFSVILSAGTTYYLYFSGGGYESRFGGFTFTPTPATVSATIGSTGFATFSSEYPLDFSATTTKAYAASLTGDNTVLLSPVTAVPANTGLLLKGATEAIPVKAGFVSAPEINLFVGLLEETTIAATDAENNSFNYVLANGSNGLGFYNLASDKTIGAGKAYLHTTTALAADGGNARVAWLFSDDETTGVQELKVSRIEGLKAGDCFNLSGQRVSQPTKGLYIVNGKKVIMK